MAAAAHGVHDQVRWQLLLGAPIMVHRPHSGDPSPARVSRHLHDFPPAVDRHVLDRLKALADMAFQKRSARHVQRQGLVVAGYLSRSQQPVAAVGQVQLGQVPVVPDGRAGGNQLIENTRKELIQDASTARQQGMDMPALGYPTPVNGVVG